MGRFVWIALLAMSTGATDVSGSLYYGRHFDPSSRDGLSFGPDLVVTSGIIYRAAPPGAHDGDGGTIWALVVHDPAVLKPGAHFAVGADPRIQVFVIVWGSPSAWAVLPASSLSGSIQVVRYTPFKELVLALELSNAGAPLFRGQVDATLGDEWVKNEVQNLDWDAIAPGSLQPTFSALSGKWVSTSRLAMDGPGAPVKRSLAAEQASATLEFIGDRVHGAPQERLAPVRIEGRRLLSTGGRFDSLLVNSLSGDELVVTSRSHGLEQTRYRRVETFPEPVIADDATLPAQVGRVVSVRGTYRSPAGLRSLLGRDTDAFLEVGKGRIALGRRSADERKMLLDEPVYAVGTLRRTESGFELDALERLAEAP